MRAELQKIQKLAAVLQENLARCAADPDVDPVHDTRTGTRRLQATLEELLRETPDDAPGQKVSSTANALMRQLKKIRRAAAPVRDLDVHRKLLEKLTKHALGEKTKKEQREAPPEPPDSAIPDRSDLLERPEAGLRTTPLEQQSSDLDDWLRDHRAQQADTLQHQARSLAAKLQKRLADLASAMRAAPRHRAAKPPGIVALDAFARLASEMQHLDAGNLHDFRKGAKKARYVAELAAQADKHAAAVAKTLKKLQDEIGDWHDWLVLAEEAHTALGGGAEDLIRLIENACESHFITAMKTAAKLRGRLMGEWLASTRKPAASARTANRQRPSKRTAAV